MAKRPRLATLKPQVQTLNSQRVRTLTGTPGATPRLSDRSGHAWAVLRAWVLREEILCRPCREANPPRVAASVEVDHIVPLAQGGTDDRSNLCGICIPCHRAKTARERGAA
jgi:5-methylcytosine-specific restriction protein A